MIPFQDTFYKSLYEIFSKFLKQHNEVKKWMIFTDYVIGDRNKSNDVITSVLIPYVFPIDRIQYIIKSIQPKDIKKTKKVKEEFIKFINTAPILFINVILNKKQKLCFKNEKKFLILLIEAAIKMLERWCQTTPKNLAHYELS